LRKYQRNYINDTIKEYIEIYKLIGECFDKYQITDGDFKTKNYVNEEIMITYLMKHTKGRYNTMKLKTILKEFELKV
jgi:hypothetical protein